MEVANEIAKGVVQVLMVPVKKQLDYVISHKKYLEDMHKKMKDLDAKKVGVESQKKQNRERRLEVPAQVSPWLEEVEQMNAKVADFPSEVPGCLDLKSRHKLGSKASKIIKEINSVLGRCPEIRGTELQIPPGRIDSTIGSTSTPSSDRSDFRSREHTFTKALEALGPNHSSHMVALWGMGGVGKTTMMKKLKEVVVEKKMFNHYVEAVIGEKTDPIAIQKAVAEYLGIDLTQTTTKSARTDELRKWFVSNSDGGKKKFLVILDDVWQPVDMEDIGLSRLTNQGIDFKVLMTSRNKGVCTEMGVKVDSILNVGCLTDSEAQSLFLQLWEPSDDVDADLYNIGEQIVRKCCGLPIAIKTMACTLRGKSKDAWKDALYRFQHPDNITKVAPTVFKTSYDNLQDEVIEETFLLCGLFPEDFNIPTEDLLMYGWGLKLFRGLDTIREARYRLNTCIERLMHTNLLIESNVVGCVKMHDLVRDFVLDMFSKDAHAAIVNHGSKPSWPENDMSASCKRISLTCMNMAEFPSDLKFPNLTILKLMNGDESLRFPQGFYGKMEKLLVISYDRMKILPSSLVCCTNLRVLRLDKCSVRFDLSCIGNLSNLEVLNFANCGVKRLPSIIGNLKKLRILDVTGCGGLRIDNDLFKKLVSLEELYACRFDSSANAISFIGDNYNEVAERWRNISALEYEFFEEKSQLMNLSFENLERFRISVECSLEGLNRFIKSKHSFENTLELVMKKGELVGSRINELFEKTIILSLSVVDMNDLEDVSVKSLLRPQPSSFRNIRVLIFSECAELRYIFTHSVANAMSNLEDLQVYDCLVMKELIHIKSGEEGRIIFPNLKSVVLRRMPKLSGLCQNVNIIALPQLVRLQIEGLPNIISIYPKNNLAVDCFLRDEVLIPTLELLSVTGMDNLKEIWPCDFRMNEEVKLREIRVERCDKLVNLFPCNPLPLLHHLEELNVTKCGSIEVLFNLDLDCVGVIEKGSISSLRSIYVGDSGKLREVWKIKGGENNFGLPIRGFQAVERILIFRCEKFRFLFTPTTTNFDIGALINLDIDTQVESSPQEAYTLSEDTHVHSMTDVEVDSVLKEKFKAEAEIETEAEAKAQAESRFRITSTKHKQKHKHKLEAETQVQPQEKVEIEAQAQAQAQAQAKTKSQAKSETETEVQAQAYSLFRRFANNSDDGDTELQKIGEDIVRKCCNLPIAIKTMALTLRNKSKNAWKDALSRLEHLDMKTVTHTVFEMSYDNLQDGETKSIFLLCGLFPKDFTIPAEELVRYGWGLKVFDGVFTIEEARRKLNTCIERLVHANLLMDGDDEGCIKMDDLVYAFVLDMLYKVEHASIINHGSMLRWPEIYTSSSCQRISLTCEGMSEFPRDLKFPNLRILKLMHGDKLLRFPPDFYAEMKILQVISYYEIKYPLLHSSPVQFFNLRVLHLHKCSLMFDCSSIGNMLNLEVLSFASSGIEWLPYTIGKLVKLRLLDLTGCVGLRIEVGVFKNLVKLEELYTIAGGLYGRAINFTDENCNEMGERSRNLSALEFEFFRNSAQLKNMSFENLQRFKISVGRSFDGDFSKRKNSYENTLQLVTDKREIIDSNVNELFKKTEVLCLNVGDISCLEDVDMKSSHSQSPRPSSFNNVRVLMVSRCEELKYVFTLDVAKALSKLEHLQVSSCDNLEELIHIDGSGEETITFPKLKFLSLVWLQNLSVLCHNVKTIELPQLVKLELDGIPNFRSIYPKNNLTTSCLLKEEVVIPELERLVIFNMENLTEIWPREFSTSKEVKLREIEVGGCDNLVNLFPCNPMIVLRHIEEFKLKNCGSIEVLFDIDLDSIGQNGEGSNNSSLKNIFVEELGKLREVWRINGADNSRLLNPNYGFQAVENIQIENCKSFHNIFTPITTNFDLGALINLKISDCGERGRNNESVNYSQDKENDPPSNEDTLQITNKISNAVIPSYLIHSFHKLRRLSLSNWEGAPEVLFEIESPKHGELVTTQSYQQRLLPYLENLDITRMEKMIHVWKCNWNEFLFYQEHERKALFHNLTTIYVKDCECIKYLFSPLMAKLLSNLKEVQIEDCGGIEKVVSEGDNEEGEQIVPTSNLAYNTSYPWLDSLALSFLPNLKCIGGVNTFKKSKFSNGYGMSWTLCQYCREISISYCDALSSAVAWSALGQIHKLEILRITRCDSMKEVFENHGTNNNSGYGSRSIDDGNGDAPSTSGLNHVIVLQLPMLRVLEIKDCDLLEHIFTFSTLQSLRNLEELIIWDCKAMKVIVKEEDDEEQTKASVSLPRIKSIALVNLPNLVGLFLGINELVLPLLDDVTIKGCPQMIVFTVGDIVAPGLKYIRTSLGKYSLEEYGLNFHVMTTAQHQTPTPILDTTGSCSFQSLIELDVKSNISLERIIPSNQLLQLQNLEKIHVSYCHEVEEVFEALEGTSIGSDESQLVVKLPDLTEVKLAWLDRLRNIWNSNQWTVFEFRNLTIVSIHGCDKLEYVFTRSMVGSLLQLQELEIRNCDHMGEVVVNDANVVVEEEEEESDGNVNEIVELPHLRSLIIDHLPCLKGFCLWKVDFSFPLLDTLKINKCQGLTVFTEGHSSTPKLREIETSFGPFYVAEEDIDSFIKIKQEEFKSNRRIK